MTDEPAGTRAATIVVDSVGLLIAFPAAAGVDEAEPAVDRFGDEAVRGRLADAAFRFALLECPVLCAALPAEAVEEPSA